MDSQINRSRYGQGNGLLLSAEGASLERLEKAEVLGWLKEAGFIVFRGFDANLETFAAFVQRLSARVTLDPARQFHGAVAQKVDAGYDAINLHCENSNTPFLPHLCWFFCEKAASAGSQTTVCDGYAVWDALSPATQERFLAQPIQYSRHVEAMKWKGFVYHSLQGRKPFAQIDFSDLQALHDGHTDAGAELKPDGSIHYSFRVPAAHRTLFGQRLAFANSILGPSYNYEAPRITFADGSPLPEPILEELAQVFEAHTENIEWRDGEIALIDNTRVMHGRRAIQDPLRTIYNALSYISPGAA
jgi:alpha-ketoglutarate-dependent taurine dioxygenase